MDLDRTVQMVAVRGLIWGIAGGLYGVVFVGVHGHLDLLGAGPWGVPLAAAVAGAVVGAFYSAKRVALVGAAVGSTASVAFLIVSAGVQHGGLAVLAVCAAAGMLAGAAASRIYAQREGVLVIAGAGLFGGGAAGLLAQGALSVIGPAEGAFGLAALLAPLTGALFVYISLSAAGKVRVPLPQWLGVGLVTGGIAGLVGLGLWALSTNLDPALEPAVAGAINDSLGDLPGAFAGGLLGAALAGMLLEVATVSRVARSRRPARAARAGGPRLLGEMDAMDATLEDGSRGQRSHA